MPLVATRIYFQQRAALDVPIAPFGYWAKASRGPLTQPKQRFPQVTGVGQPSGLVAVDGLVRFLEGHAGKHRDAGRTAVFGRPLDDPSHGSRVAWSAPKPAGERAGGASAALRDDPVKLAKLVGLVEGAH